MTLLQKLCFRYKVTKYSFWSRQMIVEALGCFIVIFLLAWGFSWLYISVVDYNAIQVTAKRWENIADGRDRKLADVLNGYPIASEPSGYKLKVTYFCELQKLTFSSDTN